VSTTRKWSALSNACLAGCVVLLAALLSVAFEVVVIPTASMEKTVLVGDHLLINRLAYGPRVPLTNVKLPRLRTLQRGDVISFHPPSRPDAVYLKRVIAVGGDRVELRTGEIYVNGLPLAEPYRSRDCRCFRNEVGRLTVPAGQLYVLGDNRDQSEDSRYWGTVPEENVVGEPMLILWSVAEPSDKWLNSRFTAQMALYLDHPLAHVRWARFLHTL
jgi:signal peptidase I